MKDNVLTRGGRRVVVDVDLSKFFDRVNHDILMGKLAKRIADKTMLGLLRRYLNAGIMASGWRRGGNKELRKEVLCRRYLPIYFSTMWIKNLSDAVMRSPAMLPTGDPAQAVETR